MFDLVPLIQTAGYIGLFLIIFAESGILIGFFLPGDSLLFTAGFLASQGYLSIVPLVLLLFVAAVAGDAVGYWFGKKAGPRVFRRPESFWFKPEYVDRTAAFFEKYGRKAIVIARFMPIIRTFIPIMAGVGGMKYRTFVIYNIAGAFIWACGVTLLGFFFGQMIPNADHYLLPIIALIILVSFTPPAIEFYKERKRKNESNNLR